MEWLFFNADCTYFEHTFLFQKLQLFLPSVACVFVSCQ
jgi:hypothetical protein